MADHLLANTRNYEPLSLSERSTTSAGVKPAPDGECIMPVPADAPAPSFRHPTHGTPTKVWTYHDADGAVVFHVCRFDKPDGSKEFAPRSWWRMAANRHEWRWKSPTGKLSLYGLDRLAENPSAPIVICEGEKATDAAAAIFPKSVVVCWAGGANAVDRTDFAPLADRPILLWPDNDDPGRKAMAKVAGILCDLACEVQTIDAAKAAGMVPNYPAATREAPEKWDAADAVAEWSDLPALRKAVVVLATRTEPPPMAGAWPTPTPITSSLPAVEPFGRELLPERIRRYIYDVADRQQCPVDFVAVTALCGLAAMVGNRVRIAPKRNDDWQVVPNLWGAIVGRPSAMKSPAMRSALGAVYSIQDGMRKEWEAEQRVAKVEDALDNLDLKAKRKDAEKAVKAGDRDEARKLLAALGSDDEEAPCPRLVVNDATVEKLGELMNENPAGLLLVRDEVSGWLARMQREEFQSERAFYLEAFNGDGGFVYDRIGRGTVRIDNCTLSIVGGIQPSRIAPLVRSALDGSSDDGLIQRLQLTVWPDDRPDWRWIDRRPDPVAREEFEQVFRTLHALSIGTPEAPAVFCFSLEGQALFRQWVEEIQAEARSGSLTSAMESHVLKMQKTVASLALLFELIDGGRAEVGEAATARALGWADYLRSHANRLYAAGETMAETGAKLIVERRAQLPQKFTARDVQRKAWAGLADREAVAAAIDVLIGTHHVRELTVDGGPNGGRPSTAHAWNPKLEEA